MISQVVATARTSFESGKTRPLAWRKAQLTSMIKMLRDNADQFAGALATDLGRGPEEAWLYDVGFSITEIE